MSDRRLWFFALAGFTVATRLLFAGADANVMIGAHIDTPGAAAAEPDFQAFEASIGRPLAIDSDYEDWIRPPAGPS